MWTLRWLKKSQSPFSDRPILTAKAFKPAQNKYFQPVNANTAAKAHDWAALDVGKQSRLQTLQGAKQLQESSTFSTARDSGAPKPFRTSNIFLLGCQFL